MYSSEIAEVIEEKALDIAEMMTPSDDDIEIAFGENGIECASSATYVELSERIHSAITEELYKIGKDFKAGKFKHEFKEPSRAIEDYSGAIETLAQEVVAESEDETLESATKFLTRGAQEALDSYKGHEDAEFKICPNCGLPLKYRSMAYDEGYHFDTCW